MRSYESLFILNIQGKEDGVDQAMAHIKTTIESLGGSVKGTQRMDRRKFERIAGKTDSGYYLGVNFELDPAKLTDLNNKFKLDDLVFRQFYLSKKDTKAAAAAA